MAEIGDIRIDDIMPHLPNRWIALPFEECLDRRKNKFKKLKKKNIKSKGIYPVIDQGEIFVSGYVDNESDLYWGPLPVIIFGDHTRRIKFVDFQFAVGADGTKIFHPFQGFYPKFFYYYLRSLNLVSQGYSRHYRFLKAIDVPIPSLNEQHRIIAKLEKLLAKVETCQERLNKIPTLLKRFRQSVLAAACSGRLTADWRNNNSSGESIVKILEGILHRREAETKTAAQKEKLRKIFASLAENDENELPEGWRFVTLSKLCASFDYGTSAKSQPSGKMPVLRMGNIQSGKIDWTHLVYTSDNDEIRKYSLRPNTVLFNRTNSPELVGKTAIYRGERPAIFAGYLIRVNPLPELEPEYLNLCLNTNYAKEFCLRIKTDGVSQSNINAQKLGAFKVPFCPILEQQEIVRRVEAFFEIADQTEERYKKAKAYVDKLTQSILAKAFRGELVPQDQNDESASVLLQKISEHKVQDSNIKGM